VAAANTIGTVRVRFCSARCHAQRAAGQDDIRRECDQLGSKSALAVGFIFAPANVNPHIATVSPTQLLQPLLERNYAGFTVWIIRSPVHQHANATNLFRLLRARRERPSSR
jgi:hypothetical protein